MANIAVSVIIPVYNTEDYLEQSLDSVLTQSLRDIEVICVDDGSTDGSLAVLREYASRDGRMRILAQENKGPGPARNCGMAVAQGKYIAFMDSDDFYPEQDTLEKLVHAAEAHNCKVAGGYIQMLRKEQIHDDKEKIYKIIMQNPEGCLKDYRDLQTAFNYYCYIFEREMLAREHITFPDYLRFEDPPFFVKAMCTAQNIYLIPHPSYVHRCGHQNITWNSRKINDVIRGHIDVLRLANEHNLPALYKSVVQILHDSYKDRFLLKNISLENLDAYLLVLQLSTIRDPEKNNLSPALTNLLKSTEKRIAVSLSAECARGGNWLCSFLEETKEQYLTMPPPPRGSRHCLLAPESLRRDVCPGHSASGKSNAERVPCLLAVSGNWAAGAC